MKFQNIFVLTIAIFCSGCGTFVAHVCEPRPRPYGGVRVDCGFIALGLVPAIVDVPISAAADTLLLPIDSWPRTRPPEELKGWKGWGDYIESTNRYCPGGRCYVINKTIMNDYPKLIEELKQKNPTWKLSSASFNEDLIGQHSVRLVFDTAPKEFVVYHLMYDRLNVRKALIKGRKQHQWHI
jgi:uncharacterized protein YceK